MTLRTVGDTTTETWTLNADLTGATAVELHVRRPDQTVIDRPITTITPGATSSTVSFAWQVGDLTMSGRYDPEVEVTFANGQVQTFVPSTAVSVRPQIA